MRFIDLHTHRCRHNDCIVHVDIAELKDTVAPDAFFSAGFHPQHTLMWNEKYATVFETLSADKNMLAVGEIGLDKLIPIPLEKQLAVFKKLLLTAERLKKPVIIHCVKSVDELLEIKKELNLSIPYIIHGFRGKKEQAAQLIQHGFYLSIGKNAVHLKETLAHIPLNRLFLETDDSGIPINDIYSTVAELLDISIEALTSEIESNFNRLFIEKEWAD